jgi:hypothetical protein
MAKLQITELEATQLIARIKAAKEQRRLLDVVMPNGKPLGDCTREEVQQIGEAMTELGHQMEFPEIP